ncbi:hypothetical protein H9Q69_013581 [Fusarium xylarioides]|nr:hypothetical protein H9Q69_013581 [Fusarium xylarioides]
MRVTSPHIVNWPCSFHDLNWESETHFLHLKHEKDKESFRSLILDADVVVDGYRPGVMDRFGSGREAIFDLVKGRDCGIIHVRENCYGLHGLWANWSGWQGISDALGFFSATERHANFVALGFGEAMGLDEPVFPLFPNSDHWYGLLYPSYI